MLSNHGKGGEEAELLNAVLLRLGRQSLPPTDLGRVDEEMALPGGRPSQSDEDDTRSGTTSPNYHINGKTLRLDRFNNPLYMAGLQ
ncbi:hypothetical protein TNCV_2945121 [Trichonephila clavipes]|nr:hypothetical protein TNCV_2945121 [Trichonephila clavipes]